MHLIFIHDINNKCIALYQPVLRINTITDNHLPLPRTLIYLTWSTICCNSSGHSVLEDPRLSSNRGVLSVALHPLNSPDPRRLRTLSPMKLILVYVYKDGKIDVKLQ